MVLFTKNDQFISYLFVQLLTRISRHLRADSSIGFAQTFVDGHYRLQRLIHWCSTPAWERLHIDPLSTLTKGFKLAGWIPSVYHIFSGLSVAVPVAYPQISISTG